MREPERREHDQADDEQDEELDGPIPAAFTYLGQFIDHDVTFDPVSSLQRLQDPDGRGISDAATRLTASTATGRTTTLLVQPRRRRRKTTFLIGENEAGDDDLPRNKLGPDEHGLPAVVR